MSGVFRIVRAEGSRDCEVAYDPINNVSGLRSAGACLAAAVMTVGVGMPDSALAAPGTYCVSGAGTQGANGTYTYNSGVYVNQADSNYMMRSGTFGNVSAWTIESNGSAVAPPSTSNVFAYYAIAGTDPTGNSWVTGNTCSSVIGSTCSGSSPAPTVTYGVCDDSDGVDAVIEDAVPGALGGTGDGNGDGTQDSLQSHVTSLPTAVGNVYATIESPVGTSLSAVSTSSPAGLPANVYAPYGAMNFTATGISGNSATFAIYVPFDAGINGAVKYNRITHAWDTIGTVSQVGVKTKITYTIQDGGPYDADGTVNGTIVDPIVPAGVSAAVSTTPVPTLSEWGVLTLSGLIGLVGLRSNRRRNKPTTAR